MGLVHPFVTEVLRELVYSGISSDNQPLEVELVGYTEVQRNVEGVMMCDERPCGRASRNRLEDRRLHFKASCFIEVFAHRGDYLASLDEHIPDGRVHDEIHISLPVFQLRVCKCIVDFPVLLLDDRKHPERLAQYCKLLGMDGKLACLGIERISPDTYNITDVKQFLEHGVVHRLVFIRTYLVPLDVHLDASGLVLELDERCCPHDSAGHYPSGYHKSGHVVLFGIIFILYLLRCRIDRIQGCRIWLDSQFPEFHHGFAPVPLLFIQIQIFHKNPFISQK